MNPKKPYGTLRNTKESLRCQEAARPGIPEVHENGNFYLKFDDISMHIPYPSGQTKLFFV